jgi:hypothetical protein
MITSFANETELLFGAVNLDMARFTTTLEYGISVEHLNHGARTLNSTSSSKQTFEQGFYLSPPDQAVVKKFLSQFVDSPTDLDGVETTVGMGDMALQNPRGWHWTRHIAIGRRGKGNCP